MPETNDRIREETPFTWYINCGMPALGELAGIPLHLLFRDAAAIVEAYRTGVKRLRELFGPDVQICHPGWAHICYGHVSTLGCELVFPDDSDVGVAPIYDSLDEGLRALQREIDPARAGVLPFYVDLWEELKKAFPDEDVPFAGLEAEGPLTTAWLLRGHDFFLDIYDDREGALRFLRAVTESVVNYKKLLASINGQPEFSEKEAQIADDGASMIHPGLWPELVVPHLDRYYRQMTSGLRLAHIENLSADHLGYLDELGIGLFDPSVSPRLTAGMVRDNCSVPFLWRLSGMQLRDMSAAEIERWVFDSAAAGARGLFFHIERVTCNERSAEKVKAFARAAGQVERLLTGGCRRGELPDFGPN